MIQEIYRMGLCCISHVENVKCECTSHIPNMSNTNMKWKVSQKLMHSNFRTELSIIREWTGYFYISWPWNLTITICDIIQMSKYINQKLGLESLTQIRPKVCVQNFDHLHNAHINFGNHFIVSDGASIIGSSLLLHFQSRIVLRREMRWHQATPSFRHRKHGSNSQMSKSGTDQGGSSVLLVIRNYICLHGTYTLLSLQVISFY